MHCLNYVKKNIFDQLPIRERFPCPSQTKSSFKTGSPSKIVGAIFFRLQLKHKNTTRKSLIDIWFQLTFKIQVKIVKKNIEVPGAL